MHSPVTIVFYLVLGLTAALVGVMFIRMLVLKDLSLPDTVNAVSIERNGTIVIPKGNIVFVNGDIVTIFGREEALDSARQEFTRKGESGEN